MRVLFICSNATHVATFAPVAAALVKRGAEPHFLGLDEYYGGGVQEAARARSLAIHSLPRANGSLGSNEFYGRDVIAIWADVLSARRQVSQQIQHIGAEVVVVGNDFGLIEKLVLDRARALGLRRVLLQDGRLSERRPEEATLSGRLFRFAKLIISPMLRAFRLSYLAASNYGEGDLTLICATSTRSAVLLELRARPGVRIAVTGQPRYDGLGQGPRMSAQARLAAQNVVMFTTPFEADRLGSDTQRAQEGVVNVVARVVREHGGIFRLKTHPREDVTRYGATLSGDAVVSVGRPGALLDDAWLAVIGISTVIEEAAMLCVPVIVPGQIVHGTRFQRQLPDQGTYPRFENADDLRRLLAELSEVDKWRATIDAQRESVLGDSVGGTASHAVAEAILTS